MVGGTLPVLVAHVADASAADQLVAIAQAGAAVFIVLLAPPQSPTPHLLEIHAPGRGPTVLVAEPLGAPTGNGCLLRLSFQKNTQPPATMPQVPNLDVSFRAPPPPALESDPLMPASQRSWAGELPELELGGSKRPSRGIEAAPPSAGGPAPVAFGTFDDSSDLDWLESGSAVVSSIPSGAHTAAPSLGSQPPQGLSRSEDEVVRTLAPFLKRLGETLNPRSFGVLVGPLEPQIRGLFQQSFTTAAWRLCSTLDLINADPPGPGSRAPYATKALEVFRDPKILEPLAVAVLDAREEQDGAASRLLVRAGKRGARALYQARLKRETTQARERFVALVRTIGAPAVPVFEVAFPLLESRLAVPGAVAIVEDLLMAIPNIHHEKLGALVHRFVVSNHPTLAPLAAMAQSRIA